jgi:hypothetical protein
MPQSFDGAPIVPWGSFNPQASAATVPSSNSTDAKDPTIEMLKQMAPKITEKDIQAAVTPITGPHAAQMPSSLSTPIQPHQDTPLDYRPVVGAGNARARGIGNTITSVMNGLGRVVTAEAQNKQNQVRDAATKVITSQQAIDEAQQQLDIATQNGDTATVAKMKDIIHQNTGVRDGIFADPKMRKALAKGFNINYVDPTQNKTSEHAAVQEAIKGAKTRQEKMAAIQALRQKQNTEAGAVAGAAYAKAQPIGLSPNTQAQVQLQTKMAEQKVAQETIKNMMNFKASVMRSNAIVDASKVRTLGASMLAQQKMAVQQDQLKQRFAQAEKLLGQRFNNSLKLISTRANVARQLSKDIYADKQADPLTIYTKTMKTAESYQQNMLKDIATYNNLKAARQALYTSSSGQALKPSDNEVKALDYQIALVGQAIQNDKANFDSFTNSGKQLHDMFGFNPTAGAIGTTGDAGATGQSDAIGEADDPTEPLNWLGFGTSSSEVDDSGGDN